MSIFRRCARIVPLFLISLIFALPVRAQSARLHTDPLSLEIKAGAQGNISIVFDHVEQLYGLEIHLSFDPAVIQVMDANASIDGVQVSRAAWLEDALIAVNKVDNDQGVIDFAATLLRPAQPVSGRKTVLTVRLQGVTEGTTRLSIEDASLVNYEGMMIPTEIQSGFINITSGGKLPTLGLGGQPAESRENAAQPEDAIDTAQLLTLVVVFMVVLTLVSSVVLLTAQQRRQGT